MKKLIVLIIAVLLLLSLTSCSLVFLGLNDNGSFGVNGTLNANENTISNNSNALTVAPVDIHGTWEIDSVMNEGKNYSVSEWNSYQGDNIDGFYITVREGGIAYIFEGAGDIVTWIEDKSGYIIDGYPFQIIDGKLCGSLDEEGPMFSFKKTADGTIPDKDVDPLGTWTINYVIDGDIIMDAEDFYNKYGEQFASICVIFTDEGKVYTRDDITFEWVECEWQESENGVMVNEIDDADDKTELFIVDGMLWSANGKICMKKTSESQVVPNN